MSNNSSVVAFAGVCVLIIGMIAGAALRGTPAAEPNAGAVRYDDQYFQRVFSADKLMMSGGEFVGPIGAIANPTPFCIDTNATSTVTRTRIVASTTPTLPSGTAGILVMQYGVCP